MSLDEFSDTVKAALYDRLRTPFFASFLVAWLGWNWDFVYFLVESDSPARYTIDDARELIDWHKGLWYPLLTSLLVFSIGGLLNLLYYRIRLGLRKIRITTLDKKDTITTDQRDKLILEHIKHRKNLSDRVAELHQEVSETRLANEELKQQNETLLLELSGHMAKGTLRTRDNDTLEDEDSTKIGPDVPVSVAETEDSHPRPTYAFDETILAKDGTFETISAQILAGREGTVIAWFEVTKDHNEGSTEAHQYILAHCGNGGRRVVIGGKEVYRNAWALQRRNGRAPQWRFITSNKNGTSGSDKLVDRRVLSLGWHSMGVSWSREAGVLDFFVDGAQKGSDVFSYWPDDIESNMTIGTWPVQTKREFDFKGNVGPVFCYETRLGESQIRRIDLETHLKLYSLERYFPGTWEMRYTQDGETGYDKNVQIKNGNQYYVNDNLHFVLENISGNLDEGLLMFTKRRVNESTDVADNRLRIVELGKRYEGEEYGGKIKVVYYRID